MKKGILVAGLLFASAFAVMAEEEHFYAVKLDSQIVHLGKIDLPATITGRVSSASSEHIVSLQVRSGDGTGHAAIYTNMGTGAVFRALLDMGQVDEINISSPKDVAFNKTTPYVLRIAADDYKEGASYAVRLGKFGDFSVSFYGNGGTVSMANKVYQPGQTYGEFPTATRTNYVHTGWSTAATNGIVLTTNTQVCLGYRKLYAQWKANPTSPTNDVPVATNSYFVAFNSNGGKGTMPTQTIAKGVAQALAANTFTRSDYVFTGWATSPTGAVAYADRAVVSNLTAVGATTTLYACWKTLPVTIRTQEVDGVLWHYSETNGVATILNKSGDAYVAAVDGSLKGTLTIPSMLGSSVVYRIGERAFAGCSSVTNIVIPLGVTSIGNCAFAGCTGLKPGITIPESVEDMGAYVFTNCPNLKIVRYLGDCPEADVALYAGASAFLISGVLRVRSGWPTKEVTSQPVASAGGDEASGNGDAGNDANANDVDNATNAVEAATGVAFASWPEGAYSRRVLPWVTQPLYRVTFRTMQGGDDSDTVWYYVPGRALGSLPEEPEGKDGYTFLGWFTKPYGGTEIVDDDVGEIIVDKPLTFYAHWQGDDDPDSLADVEYNFATTHSYDGYLLNGDEELAGTILLKTSKGRWSRAEEETNVTATATLVLLGEGKIKLKGTLGEDLSGTLTATTKSDERELDVSLSGSNMEGTFGNYTVVGVRDISGKKTYFDRTKAKAMGDDWKGNYVVALKAESDESSFGNGYVGLSVQVRANGKARVSGTMPDGTKVSYSSRMEISDDSCTLPVVVQLHRGKKGGFGFLLTFSDNSDVSLYALSNWSNPDVPFVASLTAEGAGRASGIIAGSLTFSIEEDFDIEGIDDSLLPSDVSVTVSGGSWRTPKTDSVKFVAEDSAYEVRTEYGNPSGLSLSAKSGVGTFRGRFKVFTVTEAGRPKKYTATVKGAVLDDVGYGTATIKKIGSVPVTVRAE